MLDPTIVVQELQSISLEQPLAARLVEAVDALDAYLGRMGAVIGAVNASGTPHRRPGTGRVDTAESGRSTGRDAAQAATRQALWELFEPDESVLRLPAETATDAFLGMFFARVGGPRRSASVATEELVDLFLHGAVAPRETA